MTGRDLLFMFLPDEALPLVLMVGGVAVMFGLVSWRALLCFVGLFVLFSVLSPIIDELVGGLSPWLQLLLLAFLGLASLRGVLSLLIGGGAADHVVGRLTYDLLRLPFRAARGLVRVATVLLRAGWG